MVRILKPLNNYVMKSRTLAVQDYCFITLTDYPLQQFAVVLLITTNPPPYVSMEKFLSML